MKKSIDDLITPDSLVKATKDMRKNRKPGIDGETRDQFLKRINGTSLTNDIIDQLATGTYRPNAITFQQFPKPNGKMRDIFIPTAQDGAVQKALVEGLTPLTEARFLDGSYGFRPNGSVRRAVLHASRLIQTGLTVCYSVDLETFFPNIERERLRKLLRDYNLDENTRKLINSFITAKVVGTDIRFVKGIPAGLPLAPLLANIYLHPLDLALHRLGIPFIRYADDITLFFRSVGDCLDHEKFWGDCEQRFGIIVNRKKTEMHSKDIRPVLGFHLDVYGGITVPRTVIGKIEESLNGLLADPRFLLSEKIARIRQRIAFSKNYYQHVQNFHEFNNQLRQMSERLLSQFNQFSKPEIMDATGVRVNRFKEYELIDETEFLIKAILPRT